MTELHEEYAMHRDLRLVRMQYRSRGKKKPHAQGGKKEGGKRWERKGQ